MSAMVRAILAVSAVALMVGHILVVGRIGAAQAGVAQDEQSGSSDPGARIVLVIEKGPSSAALRSGAEDAAVEHGISIDIQTVPANHSRQISAVERALDRPGLAGIAVALTDPTVAREAIGSVAAAGIPVVIVRHGLGVWESLGASAFVGQDESMAGAAAGRRLAELGVTAAICVRDVALDAIQETRCQAAAHELSTAGGRLQTLFALDPPGDPTGVRDAITARLVSDPGIDAILATEEDGLAAAIQARERASRPDVLIATFEPDADVLGQIEAGTVRFAVDQQPYVQGYLAVVALRLADGSVPAEAGPLIIVGPRTIPTRISGSAPLIPTTIARR